MSGMRLIKESASNVYLPYTLYRDHNGYFFLKSDIAEIILDEDEAIDLANAILDEFD